jgi:RNA polymerase sigma-70 factor (ECF subfamily)
MASDSEAWAEQARRLLIAARAGEEAALGELMELFRTYLVAIANEELATDVRPKAAASDIVQDTLLEACCLFDRFHGNRGEELRAWLRAILRNKLTDLHDRYLAQKRRVDRECSLDESGKYGALRHVLAVDSSTPSAQAVQNEQLDRLAQFLARMPEVDRQVILWRNEEGVSFAEIGRRLGRSEDAARMAFGRIIERLQNLMDNNHEPQRPDAG